MHFKKNGFPEEGEIVLCTVKRIQKTTVFVDLDDYNKDGIIHISEIAPGRIRTISDYVKEGKKIVCKVLRKNERYGNLDLSLRRVTTGQKLNKLKEIKLEEKSEKIIESVVKHLNLNFKEFYDDLLKKITKDYESIGLAFQAIAEDENLSLSDFDIDKKIASEIDELIHSRLKPQEIKSSKNLIITCQNSEGIEFIKKSIKKGENFAKKKDYQIKFSYISAPRYNITLITQNPKEGERQIDEVISVVEESIKRDGGNLEVEKGKK